MTTSAIRHRGLYFLAPLLALMLFATAGSFAAAPAAAQQPPTVVFMTDFGIIDDSVALCRGVMYNITPNLRIVDLTHQVTPYSILDGARFLSGAAPYFQHDAVFVVVVDPTVGSTRKAVVLQSRSGQFFVLPDNGLITLLDQHDPIVAAREITNRDWMIGAKLSSTFHGRDIFSPVGAHLARGDNWTNVGPIVDVKQLVRLNLPAATVDVQGLHAEIIATDGPFGNLVSNVDRDLFEQLGYRIGDVIKFRLGKRELTAPLVKTFSDVAIGKPLFYIDSRGHLGFSVNQRSAANIYQVKLPEVMEIPAKGK